MPGIIQKSIVQILKGTLSGFNPQQSQFLMVFGHKTTTAAPVTSERGARGFDGVATVAYTLPNSPTVLNLSGWFQGYESTEAFARDILYPSPGLVLDEFHRLLS